MGVVNVQGATATVFFVRTHDVYIFPHVQSHDTSDHGPHESYPLQTCRVSAGEAMHRQLAFWQQDW